MLSALYFLKGADTKMQLNPSCRVLIKFLKKMLMKDQTGYIDKNTNSL